MIFLMLELMKLCSRRVQITTNASRVIEKMPWCATAKSISAYLLCTFCLLAAMMLSLNFDGSGSMAQLGTV